MSNIAVIIPSRLNAERLPNKPLKLINKKEMILHVYDVAKNSNVGEVIVATPDQEILDLIKNYNGLAGSTTKLILKGRTLRPSCNLVQVITGECDETMNSESSKLARKLFS